MAVTDREAARMARVLAFYEGLGVGVERNNRDRPHSACGSLPPMPCFAGPNDAVARNS